MKGFFWHMNSLLLLHLLKRLLFAELPLRLCQNSVTHVCVILVQIFLFYYLFIFTSVPLSLYYSRFIITLDKNRAHLPVLFFSLKIVLVILGPLHFRVLESTSHFLQKIMSIFSLGLCLPQRSF